MIRPVRKLRALVALAAIFLYDIVISSLAVARIVVTPVPAQAPAIVRIPVDLRTEWGVAMFAYFTSLTPGSTCLHVSADRKHLYLHMLDAPSSDAAIRRFKTLYERWIGELEA